MPERRNIDEGGLSETNGTDKEAFETLKIVLESVGRLNRLIGACPDWYKSFRPSLSISLCNDASNAYEDARALEGALEVQRVLEPAQQALSTVSEWGATQILSLREQIAYLKLRTRFRFLPDEVLSLVLKFAAYQTREQCGDEYKAIARTLSAARKLRDRRVCKRFEQLIASSPCLWDRIHPGMHPRAISLSFARCGRLADVHLFGAVHRLGDLEDFATLIVRKSKCWRCLVVDYRKLDDSNPTGIQFEDSEHLEDTEWLDRLPATWVKSTRGLDAPLLTRLDAAYPASALIPEDSHQRRLDGSRVHFYRSWSTPNLRFTTARNLIPLPFSGSRLLKSLSINLSFHDRDSERSRLDVRGLAFFLLSCFALEELGLLLSGCKAIMVPSPDRVAVITNVSMVVLGLENCKASVVKALLGTICFPNVSIMDVEIGASRPHGEVIEASYIRSVVHAVFPSPKVFPRVKRLRFAIEVDGALGGDQPIPVPILSLPTLEQLELTLHKARPTNIPGGVPLPPLRSIYLMNGDRFSRYFVQDLNSRLREQWKSSRPLQLVINGKPRPDLLKPQKQ